MQCCLFSQARQQAKGMLIERVKQHSIHDPTDARMFLCLAQQYLQVLQWMVYGRYHGWYVEGTKVDIYR